MTKSPGLSANNKVPDAELFLRQIRRAFPDLQWHSHQVVTEGWDHVIVILDDAVVFRFPKDEYYGALLAKEVRILGRLRPLVPVRMPDYQYVPEDAGFAGYPMVPGVPIMKEYFDAMAPEVRSAFARQLAAFLTALHTATRTHDFSEVALALLPSNQAEVKKHAAKYLPQVLDATELQEVQRILRDVDQAIASAATLPPVFLHGDLYHSHLLWDATAGELGVIDFSDMNRGDPAIDFAELHEYGRSFVEEVYRHYEGPKDAGLLDRAWAYQQWTSVYMMTDYFEHHNVSFAESREVFDWTRRGLRP